MLYNAYLKVTVPGESQSRIFKGYSFGATISGVYGEVVFQTGMVGYPESLTDPSYKNQILTLTYPLIGNYGIPPTNVSDEYGIPLHVESDKIHISGLIVNEYTDHKRDWEGYITLDEWLKQHNVTGISGIDTRELTKLIREHGTLCGFLGLLNDEIVDTTLIGETNLPNMLKVVKEVSTRKHKVYYTPLLDPESVNLNVHVVIVDCGIKYNQVRMMLKKATLKGHNLKITIVNCDYDYTEMLTHTPFNRLFISNGPGDPKDCKKTIEVLRKFILMTKGSIPIFGICFGHQILALAIGASTYKLKYGNRGHNIPCILNGTKRCCITTQNHGYGVDVGTLPSEEWFPLFTNLNDGTNEGMYCTKYPYFSVQFHPEARAGPDDTHILFDFFLNGDLVTPKCIAKGLDYPESLSIKKKRTKVLILGSGGLSIGQSGEFDYSGSQAIKAFREEGLKTVLINPNIATVQTSTDFVDKVYFLPVTPEYVEKVIAIERPDCIALSFGGQTGLNTGATLYKNGTLKAFNVEVLGSSVDSILMTEDRDLFKQHITSIGEQIPEGIIASTIEEAKSAVKTIGYPVLIRAAFALGGLGSGFANSDLELERILQIAFSNSNQVIIDKSLKGWKEIEYEVMRDQYNNCITICNMENIDPLGIHTGESIVVAPSQTLDDEEYNMLRNVAIKTISSLKIVGECNIQYALDPLSKKYYIIEVNARLSRSSALASKATGYPIAYVAAKLGLGYALSDLANSITKTTSACFEPSLDYCVIKIPRWDLDKFNNVTTQIDSAMKSVGEGMAISRTFEEALQKAIRITGLSSLGLEPNVVECTDEILMNPTYKRVLAIATGLYTKKYTTHRIHELSNIDMFFLKKMENIINLHITLETTGLATPQNILRAKQLGFSDKQLGTILKTTETAIRELRKEHNIYPAIKQIDTVSGEFPCDTNYLYTTYKDDPSPLLSSSTSSTQVNPNKIIVLGSGSYKIGSSVEFDWCAVSCIRELRRLGKEVIVINCNPETVSTDYDEADKLYFDELSLETVIDVYRIERPFGVIVSMGGQIPNNIAMELFRQSIHVIGTSPESIDRAENRYKFSRMLDSISVDQPEWKELTSIDDAIQFCKQVNYPCLIRPSYVLSGAAMNVAYDDNDLVKYLKGAVEVSKDYPVVISKFIKDAKEIEVDAVAKNGKVEIMAISEHVENAGVHSGDATLILPYQDITERTADAIRQSVYLIAKALDINGPFNIQFIAKEDQTKVIECNLRVSRSFPFVSKTMGINFVDIATRIMCDKSVKTGPNYRNAKPGIVGVKVAQFSFNRLQGADVLLGVEMQSTGEVACFGENHIEAYMKALISTNFKLPRRGGNVLLSIGTYNFKREFFESTKLLSKLGYKLYGTYGTADFYSGKDIDIVQLRMCSTETPLNIMNMIRTRQFDLIINISERNKLRSETDKNSDGYSLRRLAVESSISIVSDIKCAKLLTTGLCWYINTLNCNIPVRSSIDCFTSYKTIKLPGLIDIHVHVREPGATYKEDWETCTMAALAGGITTILAMPNTNPAITSISALTLVENLSSAKAYCDYGLFLGASADNVKDIATLNSRSCGLKLYLNNTYGPLILNNTIDWTNHIINWNTCNATSKKPICVHAEGQTLAAILAIASFNRVPIHVCHVAREEEILLIKQAKLAGVKVTCEVSPHHLILKEGDVDSGLCNVKPPLVLQKDVDALWNNLDYIDCFATDHAPHTKEDKHQGCPGFPGLETALPLLLTLVHEGRLTLDDIVLRYHTNPIKIFGLQSQNDTYIEVDLNHEYVLGEKTAFTKCGWTPFTGKKVKGIVRAVVLRGKTVFMDGEIIGNKGYGLNVANIDKSIDTSLLNVSSEDSHIEYSRIADSHRLPTPKLSEKVYTEPSPLFGLSLISTSQFTMESGRDILKLIFEKADEMKNLLKLDKPLDLLKGKILASIFYEPSTRTRCSFASAMKRLGGEVIEITSEESSVQKGETLEDFSRCMECYADVLVLRSAKKQSADSVVKVLKKPLINAGDGTGEHPTQAILDMYTIREEVGTTGGICVALIGDLKNGRTVHSLIKLLTLKQNIRLKYVAPKGFELPNDLIELVRLRGVEQSFHTSIEEIIETVDVLYVTRIQRERLVLSIGDIEEMEKSYQITPQLLAKGKETLRIMHPLPRVSEITKDVDSDPRAAYFRQMQYGLYVRMAILSLILIK